MEQQDNLAFEKNYLRKSEKSSYYLAALGQGAIYAMVTTFQSIFYMQVMRIDGIKVGIFMLIAKIWDAVNDPIMGTIVDKTHTKIGKMRPYLKFTPFLIAITTILLFLNPDNQNIRLVYAIATYFLWDFAYTLSDVPFWGLPSAMTPNNSERATFLSKSRLFNCIGGALPYLIYVIISEDVLGLEKGLLVGAVFFSVFGLVPLLMSYFFTKERIDPVQDEEEKITIRENLSLLFQNNVLVLVCLFGILCFGRYMVQSTYIYASNWVLWSNVAFINSQKGIIGAGLIGLGMFPAMIFMPKLMRKYNYKKIAIGVAVFGFVVDLLFFITGLIVKFNIIPLIPFLFLSGLPLGAYNILIVALVADSIDYLEWKKGKRTEGISFSANTFVNKLGSGIANSIVPFILGLTALKSFWGTRGYNSDYTAQSYEVKVVIFVCLTLVPSISMLLAAIPMLFYTFIDKEKERILTELKSKRKIIED